MAQVAGFERTGGMSQEGTDPGTTVEKVWVDVDKLQKDPALHDAARPTLLAQSGVPSAPGDGSQASPF